MKRNPCYGWSIEDIYFLCRDFELEFERPENGSHWIAAHPRIEGFLPIPARRRIKPIYIDLLVQLIESGMERGRRENEASA